jgi:dCMP deaminase
VSRPSREEYFLAIAALVATRSTCLRRAVGCVLVDARGHVLATGYNGVARGLPHCNAHDPFDETGYPNACVGARSPSGTDLDRCEAIHAEANAVLQCRDAWSIDTAYVTAAPCVACAKLLLNTATRRVVFAEAYPGAEALWEAAGGFVADRVWERPARNAISP